LMLSSVAIIMGVFKWKKWLWFNPLKSKYLINLLTYCL
jgi:hypothetical protein